MFGFGPQTRFIQRALGDLGVMFHAVCEAARENRHQNKHREAHGLLPIVELKAEQGRRE